VFLDVLYDLKAFRGPVPDPLRNLFPAPPTAMIVKEVVGVLADVRVSNVCVALIWYVPSARSRTVLHTPSKSTVMLSA
jgi:hypothetical protein